FHLGDSAGVRIKPGGVDAMASLASIGANVNAIILCRGSCCHERNIRQEKAEGNQGERQAEVLHAGKEQAASAFFNDKRGTKGIPKAEGNPKSEPNVRLQLAWLVITPLYSR